VEAVTPAALTREAFECLLEALDPGRGSAGERYELARQKLIRFFSCHGACAAEDLADETLDRLARRLADGLSVENPLGYLLGVARNVLREAWDRKPVAERRRHEARSASAGGLGDGADEENERRLACLERCLDRLPPETSRLVLRYYEGRQQAKIAARRDLAQELGIGANALRIRMHRVRLRLEACVTSCLARASETVSTMPPPLIGNGSIE
jgi:DNA-directed RNA polymerase specialized sigma24 family protein